jgi:hypothetical protein
LPGWALRLLSRVGVYSPGLGDWRGEVGTSDALTFPEWDASGRIIGISTRTILLPDDRQRGEKAAKLAMSGGWRGLTIPDTWRAPGALFICEGTSDALALSAAGLGCIGRPSNVGGVDLLAEVIRRHVPPDRVIVWLGENDRKPDGTHPGDTRTTAQQLADAIGLPVLYALPPVGAKDVREWLTSRCRPTDSPEVWASAGADLQARLLATAGTLTPSDAPAPDAESVDEGGPCGEFGCSPFTNVDGVCQCGRRYTPTAITRLAVANPVASDLPATPFTKNVGSYSDIGGYQSNSPRFRRRACRWGARLAFAAKEGNGRLQLRAYCDRWNCLACGRWKRRERSEALTRVIGTMPEEHIYTYCGTVDGLDRLLARLSGRIGRLQKKDEEIPSLQYAAVRSDLDCDCVVAVLVSPIPDRKGVMTKATREEAATALRAAIGEISIGPGASDAESDGRHFRYSQGLCPPPQRESTGNYTRLGVAKTLPEVTAKLWSVAGLEVICNPAHDGVEPGADTVFEVRALEGRDVEVDDEKLWDADQKVIGEISLGHDEQQLANEINAAINPPVRPGFAELDAAFAEADFDEDDAGYREPQTPVAPVPLAVAPPPPTPEKRLTFSELDLPEDDADFFRRWAADDDEPPSFAF